MLIYRFSVTRPKDTVEVWLMRNKYSPFEFQFVNISNGHICPCKFLKFEDAINDMEKLKLSGKIISYERLPNFDFKPMSRSDCINKQYVMTDEKIDEIETEEINNAIWIERESVFG